MITRIKVDSFKSLRDVSLDLGRLSYFCGPNASGKSNFAEALDFLSQCFRHNLPYAVAEKGGFHNLCFRSNEGAVGPVRFHVEGETTAPFGEIEKVEFATNFSIASASEFIRSEHRVIEEDYAITICESRTRSHFRVVRSDDKYVFTSDISESLQKTFPWLQDLGRWFDSAVTPDPRDLFIPSAFQNLFPFASISNIISGIRVFRINPRTAKQPGSPSVTGELGKHGENLPSALEFMMTKDTVGFRRLEQWLSEVIPGMRSLSTGYTETKQLGLFLYEEGVQGSWYSEELSDGTLMSIALFQAILDTRHVSIVIEEPENSLHPWLLSRFLECCRQVSEEGRQVLISTQSPLVVANASPENLFLVEKRHRRTSITQAIKREPNLHKIIRTDFLNLGEYWLSGGLEGMPAPPNTHQQKLFNNRD